MARTFPNLFVTFAKFTEGSCQFLRLEPRCAISRSTTSARNEVSTRKPTPRARSAGVTCTVPLIQATRRIGAVLSVLETADVAPVSSTLLVKTRIAPERREYFVRGMVIFRKILNGLAPNVLAASSSSGAMP